MVLTQNSSHAASIFPSKIDKNPRLRKQTTCKHSNARNVRESCRKIKKSFPIHTASGPSLSEFKLPSMFKLQDQSIGKTKDGN
jgi:hypothetical protein